MPKRICSVEFASASVIRCCDEWPECAHIIAAGEIERVRLERERLARRERIAARIMAAFASARPADFADEAAPKAVKWADALILELDKS